MSFISKLAERWRSSNSMLCVGLDPDLRRMPPPFAAQADGIEQFCRQIIDATAPYACAFKPQIAYFAAQGAEEQLAQVIAYVRQTQPDLPVILDAKRSDIGATATQYAREAFERYDADAVTVNPYMGSDSIDPFGAWADRGVFLLCRTSNPGGDDIQQLSVQTATGTCALFEHVARMAAGSWNTTGQIGLVVGATYPAELGRVRELVGDMPLLVPGIGAQGGDIDATVAAGCDSTGNGMLINSSRAILYASDGPDFAQAAADAAQQTQRAINAARGR